MESVFRHIANRAAHAVGSAYAFVAALLLIVGWLASGPALGFSNTWQLLINTVTTISTFVMVFLIQNTQNRDATAMHLKLDELLMHTKGARHKMIDLSDLSDKKLRALEQEYKRLCAMDDEDVKAPARKPRKAG